MHTTRNSLLSPAAATFQSEMVRKVPSYGRNLLTHSRSALHATIYSRTYMYIYICGYHTYICIQLRIPPPFVTRFFHSEKNRQVPSYGRNLLTQRNALHATCTYANIIHMHRCTPPYVYAPKSSLSPTNIIYSLRGWRYLMSMAMCMSCVILHHLLKSIKQQRL